MLIDVVLPDRLPLTMRVPVARAVARPLRRGLERAGRGLWRDDRTVLGGSDAGAHVDLMCHANYTTVVLGESVRDRELLTLEEAVHQIADVPARLYGLRERGRVAEGWHADLVVFDPDDRRHRARPSRVHDLPGGGERLYAEARGIAHVFVNGREVIADGGAHRRPPRHAAALGRRHRHRHACLVTRHGEADHGRHADREDRQHDRDDDER